LPLLALALAIWLGWQGWAERGPVLVVKAQEGHGIKTGDALRYRGIDVGKVRAVRLAPDLSEVWMETELLPAAAHVARKGSRFWIVRPHLSLDGITGLETVVGARYIKVIPGPADAPEQREFVALEEPPLVETHEAGGVEVQLEAPARYGLRPGAPIRYRGLQVGTILSVGLASDASHVDSWGWIMPAYAKLVHEDSVFWETGGLEADLNLMGGLKLELDSLQSLLLGGIAFATPTSVGKGVRTGHRFVLHDGPEKAWEAWSPPLPVGSALLPAGSSLPEPLRVGLHWRAGMILKRDRERTGWGLLLADGLVGPADLLAPAHEEGVEKRLEVSGSEVTLEEPLASQEGVARVRAAQIEDAPARWPRDRVRQLEGPEELLLISDPTRPPLALSASRLGGDFEIDSSLPLDSFWHGAAVIARNDGQLVGILLVGDGARIAPVP
jgi:hypothetical protein